MLPKRRARLIGNTVASGALLAFATLLVTAVRNSAAFAGSVYLPLSRAVSGWLGFLFSFSSYAVAETLLVTASAVLVFCLARSVVRSVRERTAWPLLLCFTGLILCAAWVYFLFMLFWGGCYYAPKLEARLDMEPGQPTETMLVGAAESYLDDVLLYAGQVPRDGSGSVTEGGFDSLASEAVHCIRSLQLRYPDLFGGGIVTHPKRAVSYPFLGMLGIAGIYCPWTGESVVNTISTAPFLPSTMCHEMAHRLGFAPEEDANLVAYLACMESDNAVFLYSGSLMAFTYCYNAVTDPRAKGIIWDRLAENSEETLGDFSGNSEAWSEYEGPLRKTAEAVNNAYLQSMGQPEGIRSYGRVVDMLIALYLADETRNGS